MYFVWAWIMEPILFVTVGATLNFDVLSANTIPKSVIIIVSGIALEIDILSISHFPRRITALCQNKNCNAGATLRIICTFIVMSGFGYTTRERIFYALAWTPKATVQAALSAAPLALIEKFKKGAPDYDQWVDWGNDILTTGLFTILICGTLGVLAIHFASPLC